MKPGLFTEFKYSYPQEDVGLLKHYAKLLHDYNFLRQEHNALEILKSSGDEKLTPYIDALKRTMADNVKSWIKALGQDGVKKVFQDNFLKELGVDVKEQSTNVVEGAE